MGNLLGMDEWLLVEESVAYSLTQVVFLSSEVSEVGRWLLPEGL